MYQIFLSVVCIVENQEMALHKIIKSAVDCLSKIVSDFEIVIVDNASSDNSVDVLREMTAENGYPNLQVYALTKRVDDSAAAWAGVENSLGDFVAVLNPAVENIWFVERMLDEAVNGLDVIFARNKIKPKTRWSYRFFGAIFNYFFKVFSGYNLSEDAPSYRLITKRIVNYILQYPRPEIAYRYLPLTAGFSKRTLEYSYDSKHTRIIHLRDSIDKGVKLLVSTTSAPMRIVTSLTIFGALANIVYSVYVLFVAFFRANVEPGWVSLSLQQSGMFFLISIVLFVLGEYILNMMSLSNDIPGYHVAKEYTSAKLMRKEKLNIENVNTSLKMEDEGEYK